MFSLMTTFIKSFIVTSKGNEAIKVPPFCSNETNLSLANFSLIELIDSVVSNSTIK